MKIDVNIPLPKKARAGKYPFSDMKIGDSLFANGDESNSLVSSAYGWGRRNGATFTARKENDGVRVWLVKREDENA